MFLDRENLFSEEEDNCSEGARDTNNQAPVVQKVDSAIHRINHYPLDSAIDFASVYPLNSYLFCG